MEAIGNTETAQAWCKGCNDWAVVNAAYSKYIQGEIQSCQRCRH